MKVKLKLDLILATVATLFSQSKTRASLTHRPVQYSLQDVRAINGSDQYGGCQQDDVQIATRDTDIFISQYCASSTGVITDGATTVGDTSTIGWASGLLTIYRGTRHTVVLALKFQSQITPRMVQLTLFYCPSWDIFASAARIYSFHSTTKHTLVTTTDIKKRSSTRCGGHTYEVLVDEHITVTSDRFIIEFLFDNIDQEWVHIAEVVFVETEISELQPSPTETPLSIRIPVLQHISTTSSIPNTVSSIPSDKDTTINQTSITLATSTQVISIRLEPTTFTKGNRIITASVAGCAVAVFLLAASALASVCIICRKLRKSRQRCSSEEHTAQPSKCTKCAKCGYIVDTSLDHGTLVYNEAYATKSDLKLTMFMDVPNNCDVSRESAHIYHEIPSSRVIHTFNRNEDMVMVQNIAYAVTNRQVICVDNVAYASTSSTPRYTHTRCDMCEHML